MSNESRRDFLIRTGRAGLAVGIGTPLLGASRLPTNVAAHPVGTIMAVADRAGDMLAARWIG